MKKIFELPADELGPGISYHQARTLILYRDPEQGAIRATKNKCKHQGGQFVPSKDHPTCMLRCPNHDWVLDLRRMEYVNPTGGLKHDELVVRVAEGVVQIFENEPMRPWDEGRRTPEPLQAGEMTLTFLAHACVELQAGARRIITDPWLEGPAFSRGWWLQHLPPTDWPQRVATADAVYISHNHSDHMNLHSLKRVLALNPDVPLYVPDFASRSCELPLRQLGFRQVNVVPFAQWVHLDSDSRFMILHDATGRDDSGLLFDYKGHFIVNTVDCANLNNGILPNEVDVLLAAFAGGASGFPVCWEEMYSIERIRELIERNRSLTLKGFIDNVKKVRPKVAVPFAGYFTEAHPADRRIRELNWKNSPEAIETAVNRHAGDVYVWKPKPGATLDCANQNVDESKVVSTSRSADSYGFDEYVNAIDRDADFPPLGDLAGVAKYFRWTGFRDNHVLHVVETDESFAEVVREFFFDFENQALVPKRPERPHQYSRLRVRSAVFRHILRNGLPWEDISIGFQARFYREPDVYEFGFWDHFQNRLPAAFPQGFWEQA